MKTLNPEQLESARLASETISNIEFLEKRPEFIAFMGRFRRRADELADNILHEKMSPEEREALRQQRLGILEVLEAPKNDKRASLNILKGFGQLGD